MKTLTYLRPYYASRRALTPLFYDGMPYEYSTSLNSATLNDNNTCLLLRVLVPGLNKKDLNIHIEGDTLIISSTLPVDHENSVFTDLQKFTYSYVLPANADTNRITAKCRDGVLTIQIPKLKTKSARTTIQVTGSEDVELGTNRIKAVWNLLKKKFNFSEGFRLKNPVRSLGVFAR